jgi:single-strand DNA-binding protein
MDPDARWLVYTLSIHRKEGEMFLNKAIVCGNVVRNPELRHLPTTGAPVASFTVATNRMWTDDYGEKRESAEFHTIVVYGKQAEPSAQHLKKGQTVLVEGRLQTRSWEADDGTKRSRTEIIAERVQFGPKWAKGESADDAVADGPEDEVPF